MLSLRLIFSLFLIGQSTLAFAQTTARSINFNLKDSIVWSEAMRKIDLTEIKDASGNKFELMTFKSSDHAFQINCFKALSNSAGTGSAADCLIQTDEAKSQSGATQFSNEMNNQVQKISFQDPSDVSKLNALVGSNQPANYYRTSQKLRLQISIDGQVQTKTMPLLSLECEAVNTCEMTIVNGLK